MLLKNCVLLYKFILYKYVEHLHMSLLYGAGYCFEAESSAPGERRS